MRNLYLNLLVALLTFGFGVLISGAWTDSSTDSSSVDQRFAETMHQLAIIETDLDCQKRPDHPVKCEDRKKVPNVEKFYSFVKEANKACEIDNLTVSECTARKEAVIKDIEENTLSQEAIKARY